MIIWVTCLGLNSLPVAGVKLCGKERKNDLLLPLFSRHIFYQHSYKVEEAVRSPGVAKDVPAEIEQTNLPVNK